jgi:hypothetical protein
LFVDHAVLVDDKQVGADEVAFAVEKEVWAAEVGSLERDGAVEAIDLCLGGRRVMAEDEILDFSLQGLQAVAAFVARGVDEVVDGSSVLDPVLA